MNNFIIKLPKLNCVHFSKLLIRKFSRTLTRFNDNPITSTENIDEEYEKIVNETGVSLKLPQGSSFIGASTATTPTTKPFRGHNIFVIHPKIRWGSKSAPINTTPELQLEEAVTLVRTLPGFNVVTSAIVGTDYNTKKKLIWGAGRIEALLEHKHKNSVTAVMVNVDMLTPVQQSELTSVFGVPVYDRYNIVLLIFKLYAKTKEAHLQISLAEIPYIRHRLKYMDSENTVSPDALHVNQAVNSLSHGKADKYEVLRLREHTLRKKLKAIIESKQTELENRIEKGPHATTIIAVIGYTNAGKTTLVKKLTGAKNIYGEDRLFATLDTTVHTALLPSGCHVVFADTIGFISNLPVQLFASFQATLKHVINADLLIHIQDLSHPNIATQRDNVFETLQGLGIQQNLIDSMISVGNKIDKMETNPAEMKETLKDDRMRLISCESGDGIDKLINEIDQNVQEKTGARLRRLKLRPDSSSLPYLYKNHFISSNSPPIPSEDGKHLTVDVLMNDDQFSKFKVHLPNKLSKAKKIKE
jgi:GTP-binding protein HflX